MHPNCVTRTPKESFSDATSVHSASHCPFNSKQTTQQLSSSFLLCFSLQCSWARSCDSCETTVTPRTLPHILSPVRGVLYCMFTQYCLFPFLPQPCPLSTPPFTILFLSLLLLISLFFLARLFDIHVIC